MEVVAAPLGRPTLDLDPAVEVKDLAPAIRSAAAGEKTPVVVRLAPVAKVAGATDPDPLLEKVGRQAEPRHLHPHALRNRQPVSAASGKSRPANQARAAVTSPTVTRKLRAPIGTTTATAKSRKAPATKPPRA